MNPQVGRMLAYAMPNDFGEWGSKVTIDDILDEVERLDKEATPGPWSVDPISSVYVRHGEKGELGPTIRALNTGDAPLIAAYRTHAPALAAEVRRLRAVEYRSGLPTYEDVLAHQELVPECTWQIRYKDRPKAWPEFRQFVPIAAGTITNGTRQTADCVGMPTSFGIMPVAASEDIESRPVSPDGTPRPWPSHSEMEIGR